MLNAKYNGWNQFARKPPNIKTCPNHNSVKYILDATHHAAAKPKRIVQKWKEGNSQCQAGGQAPLLWSVVNLFRPAILFRTHFKILRKKSSSWRRPHGRFQGHPHEIVETFRVNGSDGVTQRKGITFFICKKKQNWTSLLVRYSSCNFKCISVDLHVSN